MFHVLQALFSSGGTVLLVLFGLLIGVICQFELRIVIFDGFFEFLF